MAIFDTSVTIAGITDHPTGQAVMKIMEKYLEQVMSEEMLDNIIDDIKVEFGEVHQARVDLNDETNEIAITVLDTNGRYIKCSSLTLFPKGK